MGQGDQKAKFAPSHHTSFCAVTRQYYSNISMRQCPHEAVQRKYGAGCKVSVYTCKRCQYGKRHPLTDAWGCDYKPNDTPNNSP